MPTALSSTDRPRPTTGLRGVVRREWRAVVDVGHLVRLRAETVRRRRMVLLVLPFLLLTAVAAVAPAYLPGARESSRATDVLVLMPTALAGFLVLALVSAIASGGGRELVPHEQTVAYPVSPTTDHLGALVLAPLNIAWLIQSWMLLGSAAYALGTGRMLIAFQIGIVLWILAATAIAQVLSWTVEGVRRLPHGVWAVRGLAVAAVGTLAVLQVAHLLGGVLDELPTRWLVVRLLDGFGARWWTAAGLLVALLLLATAAGAVPARLAARRPPRDELRSESGSIAPRSMPSTLLAMVVRMDRASVWRAVPMRRGLAVLAIGPGLVSLAGALPWAQMTILPGLVASGGALLFGVNAWCLEGRGVLWRESLPCSPAVVFTARAWVLAEFLVVASSVTLGLAALRAGRPEPEELAALGCAWVVVVLQVVAAAMTWSHRQPFAVDLRSARATPAPPVTMVSYSAKLAVSTTLTGLLFSLLARVPAWELSVLAACPFLLWSGVRLLHARDAWVDPHRRGRVIMAVAG